MPVIVQFAYRFIEVLFTVDRNSVTAHSVEHLLVNSHLLHHLELLAAPHLLKLGASDVEQFQDKVLGEG